MSSESLAALRKHQHKELEDLAQEHFKHDLTQSDRDTIAAASKKFSTYAAIGSGIGLGLGVLLAFRVRSNRAAYFKAFRAMEKPTHVQFPGGRTEALPDITPFLKPSTLGDVAAYVFFSTGGLFLFGELGGLIGTYSATRSISSDPEAAKRIENAWKKFRADVLRREAEKMESGEGEPLM